MTLPFRLCLGGIYRHYKFGDLYRVHRIVLHTETQQQMVLYEGLMCKGWYVRPLDMFMETVPLYGKQGRRFTFVESVYFNKKA